MKRYLWVLALALLVLVPVVIRAQEPGPSEAEKLRELQELMERLEEVKATQEPGLAFETDDDRVLRLYNVADLTMRLTDFVHPNLALKPAGAEIDEDRPLFGRSWEGEHVFVGPEELLDMIVQSIRPEVWETGWASIHVSGPFGLMVLAEKPVQDDIASFLSELRTMVGRTVTIEVRLIEADAASGLPTGKRAVSMGRAEAAALVARAEAGQGLKLVRSARVTGLNGQRVMVHAGAQHSILQDYDVEVAQDASISDPIVGILQTGLAFDVRPIARGGGLISVEITAQSNLLDGEVRTVVTPSGPVQAPKMRFAEFNTTVTIVDGGSAIIGGGTAGEGGRYAILLTASSRGIVEPSKGGGR